MKSKEVRRAAALLCALAAAVIGGCAAQPREPGSGAGVASGTPSAADADPTSPLSSEQKAARAETLELLQAGRYAELEARMNGFQQAYRSRAIGDLDLLREFGAFARTESALRGTLDAWVQEYPASYAAHLARGIYYFKCGVVTRGKKYIERTTPEQIRGMEVYLGHAREDLLASMSLDAMPLLSYRYLILIGMELGERDRNRDWLDQATALDADSIVIRRPYMISLETRWGGSLDAMEAFLDASRQAGASPAHLWMLQKLIDRERVWLHTRPPGRAASESDDAF